MKPAVLVFAILLASLAATAAYLREPVTVDVTHLGTWRIPVGPPFDAVPPAMPPDWRPR